ncbi:MAG TPA: YggS family pyridoxal phosphate-dependent enzyme [Chitinophagaceae bacterium]|nr:YggS family pyridoxal phosphate-dependent enzyme [Chitinophagaceae bacterium]
MAVNREAYVQLIGELGARQARLVAVSKTKSVQDIQALYELGQRDFGENYVQELLTKQPSLPADIRWHFIGHLQRNKVKFLAPFVHLVQSVDSGSLLAEIDRQARQAGRVIDCLLQVHIAQEETKFGLDEPQLDQLLQPATLKSLPGVRIAGLMGMASLTADASQVHAEFHRLRLLFDRYASRKDILADFRWLSMGMSGDYSIALAEGSNLVRIGSLLFGARGQ